MPAFSEQQQRVGRLTPWREALAALEGLAAPVPPQVVAVADSVGCIAAEDLRVQAPLPPVRLAARDGWAVRAALVADAGPYAPTPLSPPPLWVESGEPLPEPCDAVLPPDAVTAGGAGYEALAPVAPGEGVTAAGADAGPDVALVLAGRPVSATAQAALGNAGIATLKIRRPSIGIVCLGAPSVKDNPIASLIGRALEQCGASPVLAPPTPALATSIATENLDALISFGGTGQGREDRAALTVAAAGRLTLHGVGICPGETAGLGVVAERPVLLLPGRLDAALAAWLLLGRPLLRRLTGATDAEPFGVAPLTRKLASRIGLAEAVLVTRDGDGVRPLAAETFPLAAMARADGWVLVPPDSEGYASGTEVAVRPLP